MGVPEFSSSLTDFNQAQLDAIEQSTEDVLAAVNVIKNTDISLLNTKIGVNTAAAGTTSVFARLAQISAYVDTLETLLGVTGAAAGTGSVFARLAQISGYVDTVETLLGVNTAAAGTTSVFARLAQIDGKVGVKTNTIKTANFTIASPSNAWYVVANVTGKGTLFKVIVQYLGAAEYAQIRITIDGTALIYTFTLTRGGYSGNSPWSVDSMVSFDTNLTVEVSQTSSPNGLYGTVDYGLV